jgi:arylsulfatase A-like enzyme
MPTLAELAGLPRPPQTDGLSLVPLLLGEEAAGRKQEQHQALFWESRGTMAVRIGDWKAIKPKANAQFELYDLNADIQEQNNVADQHPEIMSRVQKVVEFSYTPERPGRILDDTIGFKRKKAK